MIVLKMAPRLRPGLEHGYKFVTIRRGHRTQFVVGDTIKIESVDGPWGCSVKLTEVRFDTFGTIPYEYVIRDGFIDREKMLEDLQSFYPDITMESDSTVLVWEKVTDFWEIPAR